jgi:hypothetical protein
MIFSNDAIFSLLTGCLVLFPSLEGTNAVGRGGLISPAIIADELVLFRSIAGRSTVGPGGPISPAINTDQICGGFSVHAGDGGIVMAAGNVIGGGDIGVNAASFTAPNDVASHKGTAIAITSEIGGLTFREGAYKANTLSIAASQSVTLDGNGDPNAQFIFYSDTTLLTHTVNTIELTGGAQVENVFWVIGSAMTTGADNILKGSFLVDTAVTFGATTNLEGCITAGTKITFGSDYENTYPGGTPSTSTCPSSSMAPSLTPSGRPSSFPTNTPTRSTPSPTKTPCDIFSTSRAMRAEA